jgi:hypothetical protein
MGIAVILTIATILIGLMLLRRKKESLRLVLGMLAK